MIHMKLSLDQRRMRVDGTYPLVFRITYNSKSRSISTGFKCKLSEWDTKKNEIIVNSDSSKLLSSRLTEQRLKLQEKLLQYERTLADDSTNVQDVKEFLVGKLSQNSTVLEFWKEEIERLEHIKNFGNSRNYKSALGAILNEASLNIQFSKIDYAWLINLESSLKAKGVKTNSVAVYMRTLRALYNKALNMNLVDPQNYPFRRYKIKTEPTTPRVASINELKMFFNYEINTESQLSLAWDIGRLIFLLRGINFADLALLTNENLKHGRIIYKRAKTHKMYSIKLLPLAKSILDKYISDERKTLLPIFTNDELNQKNNLSEKIGQYRKNYNSWLSKIGKELGINEKLTTYVFRYSYSNVCKSLGYSKDMIGEALGHSIGSKVTGIYLQDYDLDVIDEMNEVVCKKVTGGT